MAQRGRPKGSSKKKKDDEIEIHSKSKKGEQGVKNTASNVDQKMESKAESTAAGKVVDETKKLATDIQTTKEVLGDIVYNAFFDLGLEPADMIVLLKGAIDTMVENYQQIEKLQEEHEIALDLLQSILAEYDKKKITLDLVRQYQQDCVVNQITPDIEYVNKLLMESVIHG